MSFRVSLLLLLSLCGPCALSGAAAAEAGFDIAGGHYLASYGAPTIALAGDIDGSGRASLFGVNPDAHVIDFAHMTTNGKLTGWVHARDDFGSAAIAVTSGDFSGSGHVDTLAVLPNGTVTVAYGMTPGTKTYAKVATAAATLDKSLIPKSPAVGVTADFDGDGKADVLLVGADGKIVLLRNARAADGTPHFDPKPVDGDRVRSRRFAAGNLLSGDRKASLVWIERNGGVLTAQLETVGDGAFRLGRAAKLGAADPDDGLAIGHFRGPKSEDVIVGQRLFPNGDATAPIALPNLPRASEAKDDVAWIAADFNGDGKDDLLRVHRSGSPFDGDHLFIHYAHDSSDTPALQFDDSDDDGLPDAWETGAVHPGGLDLKAMGCSTKHADVILEVQRIADVPEAQLHLDIDKMIKYFAALPVKNPDGVPGIAVHVIYDDPIPITDNGKGWQELAGKYHAANHHGITHWMVIYKGGGGQSSEMGDEGSCGCYGMPAVFMHEFGHQLGLDHTGRWGPSSCPVYPSLMNYSYNYQLGGKSENVGFSDGRLSSVVLDERHLNEYLPLPMAKIAYLAGPPYHFRMKPAPDGKGTLIDWNWNGVFGEKDIEADINYGYSTTGGDRHWAAKTFTAPSVATAGVGKSQRLLVFYTSLLPNTPVPAVDPKAKNASLSPDMPGSLNMKLWAGKNRDTDGEKWSAETVVAAKDVVGESSATTIDGVTWFAYPTLAGVVLQKLTLQKGGIPVLGKPTTFDRSVGAQPTMASVDGRLVMLLWRDARTPIGMRWINQAGASVGPETLLPFTSNVPVGAAPGLDANGQPALWVGLTQDQDARKVSRWQIRCFTLDPSAQVLYQTQKFWADGDAGGDAGTGRVTLLWEPDKALGPDGRWYFLQRGSPGSDLSMNYIGMRIADKTVNGGCLTRRYYDEWTQSRSAPSACWFRDDFALGVRWFGNSPGFQDNYLYVGFYGRGIESTPMGDFDDLTEIRNFGMTGSIPRINE